jgi:hypothetical protein
MGRPTERCKAVLAAVAHAAALSFVTTSAAAGGGGSVPAVPSASDLKVRADAAMDDGAYADAIAGYHASYEISRNPALLYNIGSAYERLGDYPHALVYLEQFSAVASSGLKARVPALGDLIASLRLRLAHVTVGCNVAGARVLVRGSWRATTPLAVDIPVLPGLARVDVLADGYQRYSHEVFLAAGKETRLDAFLLSNVTFGSPPPEPRRDADAKSGGGGLETKWWFWTGLGVVVAAGATVGIVLATTHHSDGSQPTTQTAVPLLSW